MALRDVRGAGRGGVARGRAGLVLLACALYLGAGALATWPALRHAGSDFLAGGGGGHGEAAPGDHLQTAYHLWLPGHQLEHVRAPWLDPYSFRPEASQRVDFAGWPFGLVFWPLWRALGLVRAWNVFMFLGYLGAGGCTALWLRSLGLGRAAALAGGIAFALAPYRVAQSTEHLLGPISMALPLALWAWEDRRAWLAAVALASIPLSGQVHLALGAIPLFLAYAWARPRASPLTAAAVVAVAAAAGLLVWAVAIHGTVGAGGRSFAQVTRYAAEPSDLLTRHERHGLESYVFLGWLTPALALAGLAALVVGRRLRLALVLGLAAGVPIVLALGDNLPFYEPLWRHLPALRETRVPERLMPVACLAIAALAAAALDAPRRELLAALALVLVAGDLRAGVERYQAAAADPGNAAYTALRRQPPGRLLELPAYLPDRDEGSIYLYYAVQAQRQRPGGYSTTAPLAADQLMRRVQRLACRGDGQALDRLLLGIGVRYVAVHRALPGCHGGRLGSVLARGGAIELVRVP